MPPKIVGERKKEITEQPPPKNYRTPIFAKPLKTIGLYISEEAEKKMWEHSERLGEQHLEALGFLVGNVFTWEGKTYTVVRDIVHSELDTTSVSVKFRRDAFEKLFDQLDNIKYDYILVGWYHSHPGHTCFMSGTDIATQKSMFNKPYQWAVVVDPINKEIKAYRGDECKEEDCVIYSSSDTPEFHYEPTKKIEEEHPVSHPPKYTSTMVSEPPSYERIEKKSFPTYEPEKETAQFSGFLYLLPLIFGIFGGVVGFFITKKSNIKTAQLLLISGIIMGIIWLAVGYWG